MLFETEVVACICHSPLHHQKPDFEGQSVIKTSSYLLPFVLEAHRESLPRSCETSARRLSAESAEVYSTADLPASAAHTFPSQPRSTRIVVAYPRPASSATNRTNKFQPVLINNSKFLKATHRTKIWEIEIPRSMVVGALSW